MLSRIKRSPWPGVVGAMVAALWEAVTAVGFPPHWPNHWDWTWILFVVFVSWSLAASLYENQRLKHALEPKFDVLDEDVDARCYHSGTNAEGVKFETQGVIVMNKGVDDINGIKVELVGLNPDEHRVAELGLVMQPQNVFEDEFDDKYRFSLAPGDFKRVGVFGIFAGQADFVLFHLTRGQRRTLRAISGGSYYSVHLSVTGSKVKGVTKKARIGVDGNGRPHLRLVS